MNQNHLYGNFLKKIKREKLNIGRASETYMLPKNYSRGTIGYISNSCSSKYLMRLGIAFNIFFT